MKRETLTEALKRICHDEQMTIWSGEIVGRLAMGDYLRDDISYDDKIGIHAAVSNEIRSIIASVLEDPAGRQALADREAQDHG